MKLTLKKSPYGLVPDTDKGKQWLLGLDMGAVVEANMPDETQGTIPMLRTWRKWMGETAAFMAARGCTMPHYIDSSGKHHGTRPFNADDAHELFTSTYLGVDEEGKRKSWSLTSADTEVQASMGDRLHAMDTHLLWCMEKGIKLTIPRKSEYQQLRNQEMAA
jgi:hypothetical protein